jgi:hypothetical protein
MQEERRIIFRSGELPIKLLIAAFLVCLFGAAPALAATPPESCAVLKAVRELKMNVAPGTAPASGKTPVVASTRDLAFVRSVLLLGSGISDMKLTRPEVEDLRQQLSHAGPESFTPDCDWTADATAFEKSRLSGGASYSFSAPLFSRDHGIALVGFSRGGFISWVCAMRKEKGAWSVSGNCQNTFMT